MEVSNLFTSPLPAGPLRNAIPSGNSQACPYFCYTPVGARK
ncbi:hypothetical protein CKAH01_09726 [Colletotrichum kahawae]|uniref:Uncharacterized protein n=1 Tax=Colletotrichum kahawae TaxID=34407 RepID=A0AAD9XXT8_COLKA|nr:hypothetical protein CKAH01_09726 [Colletotrichum kahawae]